MSQGINIIYITYIATGLNLLQLDKMLEQINNYLILLLQYNTFPVRFLFVVQSEVNSSLAFMRSLKMWKHELCILVVIIAQKKNKTITMDYVRDCCHVQIFASTWSH